MAAVLALGAFGSLIGSFLNVVVYRVPLGRSIVSPPSACGSCGHAVRAHDNIPIVSWLVLRGRCRDCRAAISVRYPLVEAGAGILFAAVALRFAPGVLDADATADVLGRVVELAVFLYFAAISLALALIDLDTRRLPNSIVLPAYAVGAVLLLSVSALTGEWSRLLVAAIGLVGLGGGYLLLAVVRPGGMGMGDVKLAGVVGLMLGWLGPAELAVGALGGIVVGGVIAVGLLLAGHGRRASLAYGPWLLVGAWIGIFAGEPLARGYLALFGITT